MKNINKIIAIAVLAVFAVGCTDEDDLDSSGAKFNKKNTTSSSNDRKYPQYEEINYSSIELNTMLKDFDFIVNDKSSSLSDMSIEKALYIMEAYTNYGVIDKANSVGKENNDALRTFTLTVPLTNGQVKGSVLKDLYLQFAVNILETMRGKIMPLSDMYVQSISSESVTFGFEVNVPPSPDYTPPRYFFPEFYSVGDNVSVPEGIESLWTHWYSDLHATPWEIWPLNELGQAPNEVVEHNVYRYSIKPFNLIYNTANNTYFTYYTGIKSDLKAYPHQVSKYVDIYNVVPTHPVAYYDNLGIQNILIPAALGLLPNALVVANSPTNQFGDRVVCDYCPHIYYQLLEQGNPMDAIYMYINSITIGYRHSEQPQMMYTEALASANIYPEL